MTETLSAHHCEELATKLRSNPDCLRGKALDRFAALAMTAQEFAAVAQTHAHQN